MTRNLDHRSEVAVPLYDKDIQREIRNIIEILWSDNTKARVLGSKQNNEYRPPQKNRIRAQEAVYHMFKQKN